MRPPTTVEVPQKNPKRIVEPIALKQLQVASDLVAERHRRRVVPEKLHLVIGDRVAIGAVVQHEVANVSASSSPGLVVA